MSTTDLFGRPLTSGPEFRLNKWQKRQATLLYHFASLEYLEGLKRLVDDFVNGVDVTLDLAKRQGRDQVIANERWGVRDTSANFSTYGFAALREYQQSIVRDIAMRSNECYEFTGHNQCARLLGELSLGWSTPQERERFEAGMEVIGHHASSIDTTMEHAWSDGSFDWKWQELSGQFARLPKFRVRTDVDAQSNELPLRTGVYVPQDDPYGSLQFAWTGNSDGCLSECRTFNDLGLEAVQVVGRDAVWRDDPRLLPIVKQPQYLAAFKELDWFKEPGFLNDATRATAFIARAGIAQRPCKWYFVEMLEGEFEDPADEQPSSDRAGAAPLRCEAGNACPREGWWFTPAREGSRRRFAQGEVMPEVGGDWGATIWQWDDRQ